MNRHGNLSTDLGLPPGDARSRTLSQLLENGPSQEPNRLGVGQGGMIFLQYQEVNALVTGFPWNAPFSGRGSRLRSGRFADAETTTLDDLLRGAPHTYIGDLSDSPIFRWNSLYPPLEEPAIKFDPVLMRYKELNAREYTGQLTVEEEEELERLEGELDARDSSDPQLSGFAGDIGEGYDKLEAGLIKIGRILDELLEN